MLHVEYCLFFSDCTFFVKKINRRIDILGMERIIYLYINFNAKNCFVIRVNCNTNQPDHDLNSYCEVLLQTYQFG